MEVGNGHTLKVEGCIPRLQLTVQGHSIIVPVYLLRIEGPKLILREAWLATLGPHLVDYSAHNIQFYWVDNFITLQGKVTKEPASASPHQLQRLYNKNLITECYTVA